MNRLEANDDGWVRGNEKGGSVFESLKVAESTTRLAEV